MKRKFLMTVVLAGVLTSGAYAYGGYGGQCGNNGYGERDRSGGFHKKNRGSSCNKSGKAGGYGCTQIFSKIELSQEQHYKLSILRDEMRLEIKKTRGTGCKRNMSEFIGDKGFDKKAFLENSSKNDGKIAVIHADHMEKVFKILTKKQISKLKK
ncbi:MAG: hypothetical protein JJV95_01700 [Sulfurospirillum sp.]|nr:hypothetical protein [Sulfurospirillum sp.]MBL0702685.1 hypothetical protein [Sulfurospirillum sp.]